MSFKFASLLKLLQFYIGKNAATGHGKHFPAGGGNHGVAFMNYMSSHNNGWPFDTA